MEQYYIQKIVNGAIKYVPVNEKDITIKGRTIDEIIDILNALDIERIYDIKVTMSSLKEIINIYEKEQNEMMMEALKNMEYEKDTNSVSIKIPAFKGGNIPE